MPCRRLVLVLPFTIATACTDTSGGAASGATSGNGTAGAETGQVTSGSPNPNTSDGSGATSESTGSTQPPPIDWELDPGHFYPAVMEPVAIYPRPDDEVENWARHRWAHPDIEYRIPAAVVQGGAWPFLYELVDGPQGAYVGQTLQWEGDRMVAPDDYGVLSWTPGAADEGSTVSFHVRVTDQEGTTVDTEWTTVVDSSRFVFVAPDGNDAAAGTIDAPLLTASGWYLDDPNDSTYADRLVYFRGGNYTPLGSPTNNNNFRMETARKPKTLMGVPGEDVEFDSTQASWTFWEGGNDIFISGIHFNGSKITQPDGTPLRNSRNIAFYGGDNQKRVTMFENKVSNIQPGNPADDSFGNDNPAFVWRPNSGTAQGEYWAFIGNDFDTAGPRRGNGPSCVSLSNVSYIVYEHNSVVDWDGTGTFFDKSNNDHLTQRNNDLWQASLRGTLGHALGGGLGQSYNPAHVPGFFETCWNRIRTKDTTVGEVAVAVGGSIPDSANPVWVYRNSIRGNVMVSNPTAYEMVADKNVLQGGYFRQAEGIFTAGDNVVNPDFSAVLFDDQGWLSNTLSDNYGTHGAEVR